MKHFIQISFIFLFAVGSVFAQQEKGIVGTNNWLNNWTEFNSNQKEYGEPTQILTGTITEDTKLSKREVYLLMGNVFVTNNATLTIEPGTVIIGDFNTKASLTIAKGASIIANGLETDPIVFTSSRSVKRPGDWGGIIILGDGPTNKFGNGSVSSYYTELNAAVYKNSNFGGENPNANSGVMRYVRIEYAGKRISSDTYFSGLFLAGVGNETIFENIMISFCAGNSYEVWGGEVHFEKVVSYKSSSNDFKFNLGTQSKLYNSLAVRSPYVSSSQRSRCLQVISYDKKDEIDFTKKGSFVEVQNITLLTESDNLKSDIERGLVKEAIFIGQNASLDMSKSVVSGFNPAVLFEESIMVNQENLEKIKFTAMYFNNCDGNIFVENNYNNEDLENWYGNSAFFNVYSKSDDSETFIDLKNPKRPDFRLRINKIIATSTINLD
ncbi:hypothetical protein ACFFU9_02385 [Mariniflexile ostreae]|uniref:T9SS C-terminal target domain-containing protein n=1 Tax=Mariniflexile ostreae TaxID=1520892 RepID=A0ABV5F835_9FLAO